MNTQNEKLVSKERLGYFWGKVKNLVTTAVDGLSTVYAAIGHKHTRADITDLADATDKKGGLMTDAQAQKLASLDKDGNANIIEAVKVNGVALTPDTQKAVDIPVPTKMGDIENDQHYVKDASYVHTDKNFTDAYETKLKGVAAGAQVNVVETIQVNGAKVNPAGKTVNITVPTDNASLANGAGYQTAAQVAAAVEDALKDITSFDFAVVAQLPAEGAKGTIYLIAAENGTGNSYDEYIWLGTQYERLGSKELSLAGYVKYDDLQVVTQQEIDEICV